MDPVLGEVPSPPPGPPQPANPGKKKNQGDPAGLSGKNKTKTMPSNSNILSIKLTFGSKTFALNIDREREEVYRTAEKLINQKLQTYMNRFADQTQEDYLTMALLDITVHLVDEKNIDKRLEELIKKIDKTTD